MQVFRDRHFGFVFVAVIYWNLVFTASCSLQYKDYASYLFCRSRSRGCCSPIICDFKLLAKYIIFHHSQGGTGKRYRISHRRKIRRLNLTHAFEIVWLKISWKESSFKLQPFTQDFRFDGQNKIYHALRFKDNFYWPIFFIQIADSTPQRFAPYDGIDRISLGRSWDKRPFLTSIVESYFYFIIMASVFLHAYTVLCSTEHAVSAASWPILFKFLTLNFAICNVQVLFVFKFVLCWFFEHWAWATTSAEGASFYPRE